MLHRLSFTLVVVLTALISLTSALPVSRQSDAPEPIRWRTPFGKHLVADSSVELEWEGGSGHGYDVYFIPQWPRSADIKQIGIAQTRGTSVKWRVPKLDAYPDETTFIIVVRDQSPAKLTKRSMWYDTTPSMLLTPAQALRRA